MCQTEKKHFCGILGDFTKTRPWRVKFWFFAIFSIWFLFIQTNYYKIYANEFLKIFSKWSLYNPLLLLCFLFLIDIKLDFPFNQYTFLKTFKSNVNEYKETSLFIVLKSVFYFLRKLYLFQFVSLPNNQTR